MKKYHMECINHIFSTICRIETFAKPDKVDDIFIPATCRAVLSSEASAKVEALAKAEGRNLLFFNTSWIPDHPPSVVTPRRDGGREPGMTEKGIMQRSR